MPSRYIHLANQDVELSFEEMHDLRSKEEKQKEEEMKPPQCPRCQNEDIPASKRFCGECGVALDKRAAMDIQEGGDEIREKASERTLKETIQEMQETMKKQKNRSKNSNKNKINKLNFNRN